MGRRDEQLWLFETDVTILRPSRFRELTAGMDSGMGHAYLPLDRLSTNKDKIAAFISSTVNRAI